MGIFRLPKNQQMVQGFPVNRSYTKAEADNKFTTDLSGYVPYTGATGDVDLGAFDLSVADEAYGAGWNGSLEVPTKNALYDKIEAITFSPAGSDTQVQFNDGGVFGADAGLTYNKTTGTLTVGTGAGILVSHAVRSDATDGIIIESANGTDVGILGAGNTANVTWYGSHNYDAQTANTIASFGASKTLSSLSTATYPSLTELSYVKGVTSAIQTQLNTKGTFTLPSLTTGSVLFSNGSTIAQDNSNFFYDSTNHRLALGHTAPDYTLDLRSSGQVQAWIGTAGSPFGYTIGRSTSNGFLEIFGNQGIFSGISVDQIKSAGAITIAGNAVISNWATTLGIGSGSGTPNGKIEIRTSDNTVPNLAMGGGSGFNYNFKRNTSTGYLEITGQQSGYTGFIFSPANGANAHTINDGGNNGFGVAIGSVSAKVHIVKTTEQLRVGYDASNYYSTTVSSTGGVTFDAVGSGASFTFSDNIKLTQTVTTEAVTSDTTVTININGTDYKLLAKA